MLALSVRQPYAELILRGLKTIEYRSRATRIVGQRFYLYAAGKPWTGRGDSRRGAQDPMARPALRDTSPAWSTDLSGAAAVPPWMTELANGLRLFPHDLPTGVIVGSAVIERVTRRADGMYQWHLTEVRRATRHRRPARHPQPVWWKPFG